MVTMCPHPPGRIGLRFNRLKFDKLAPVPPISANRGLNIVNPELRFILRLDSVPESTFNTTHGINERINLTHMIKQTKWRTYILRYC